MNNNNLDSAERDLNEHEIKVDTESLEIAELRALSHEEKVTRTISFLFREPEFHEELTEYLLDNGFGKDIAFVLMFCQYENMSAVGNLIRKAFLVFVNNKAAQYLDSHDGIPPKKSSEAYNATEHLENIARLANVKVTY